MTRRRRKNRIKEEQTSYLVNSESSLPSFTSTPHEIQRAVERNSIKRGVFIIKNLMALNFDGLFRKVEQITRQYDKEKWHETALQLWIDPDALRILDNAGPPVPYPYYFCTPDILRKQPELIIYYRNAAMISQKVMNDMGLNTTSYETGLAPPIDIAQDLTHYFNEIISALIKAGQITPQRHLEMAFANLGDSLGGSWRNEVGRLAYAEVVTPLALYLYQQDFLESIIYKLKGRVVVDDEDEHLDSRQIHQLFITETLDLKTVLADLEEQRIVYRELRLRNGNRLLLNRQITWQDAEGTPYRIGPDLFSSSGEKDMLWGGELKGGADPAGSDEHWKTATRAFDRILLACERTGRPKPPLSFIATILVERVATEAAEWVTQGKLKSVYNLTQITDDPHKQQQFLADLTSFLGYPNKEAP